MLSLCLAALLFSPTADFDIKDGDRIVMVGGALIEREQQYGYLELMLHMRYPDRKFTVRNLGWSGDTVWGEARAEFGTQADGYRKLVEQVKAAKPTVLILGYGTNEAYAAQAGVKRFAEQYRRFLAEVAPPETRCIFLTIPAPRAKPSSSNRSREIYDETIRIIAKERSSLVVGLGDLLQPTDSRPLTDDGILPNDLGYQYFASMCLTAMTSVPDQLVMMKSEPLRQLILRKNELYFHQYRPQNDTYLFLFRKHEQGNNAAEIPKFGPLIEELDAKINELKAKK